MEAFAWYYGIGNVIKLTTLSDCVRVFMCTTTQTNATIDSIMHSGWCVISTWIEPKNMRRDEPGFVSNVSFRFGFQDMRLIVTADLYVPTFDEGVVNIDSDMPGSEIKLTPTQSTESWKLKMASIAGYGPCSGVGPGLVKPTRIPEPLIVGLDIEVSTFKRKGMLPLPHDGILSIAITNGGWYTKRFPDVCFCIYTNGYHHALDNADGRTINAIKVASSADAVTMAYMIIDQISPDFVSIHNGFNFDLRHIACCSTDSQEVSDTFEERRLGNSGVGVFWRLTNGTMCLDTMYYVDRNSRANWSSLSLAKMAERFDLPPKLDTDTMMIDTSIENDMTSMIVYNCRDADLHVWVAESMNICERVCMLAGASRSTLWDSVANNTGVMTFCMIQSVCMTMGKHLDLSKTMGSDEKTFEGGHVLDPRPGCYKGVIVIDGNSLYGSIMSKLGIFVDRCASATSIESLSAKMYVHVPEAAKTLVRGDVMSNSQVIVMRTTDEYLGILRGKETVLSEIISTLISVRTQAKTDKDAILSSCYKVLLVSVYGAMGSKHGALSSKTCAQITTYAARYYLMCMIECAQWCGCSVVYGDTDSIFCHVGAGTEYECASKGEEIKSSITERMCGTVFEGVGADIKGNYMSIIISSKKKYEAVDWHGIVETKGLAPVKKDTLPITRFVVTKLLDVINRVPSREEQVESIVKIVAATMSAINSGSLDVKTQMIEKKINGLPHYEYKNSSGYRDRMLVENMSKNIDVDRNWVVERVRMAADSVLTCAGLNTFQEIMFLCEARRKMRLKTQRQAVAR